MEPATMTRMVKEGLSLKLETPYMLAASTLGLLSVFGVMPGNAPFQTPFEGLAKFFVWTGWLLPSSLLDAAHQWINDSSRLEATHGLFVILALFGTVFASYSRASFAALVGSSGLVETGSTTEAWLIPVLVLIAMILVGAVRRRWSDDAWKHAWLTCFWMGMALAYCILALCAFIFGESRARKLPQTVKLELPWETQTYIDERLTAFGMPALIPPVSIPPIASSRETSLQLTNLHREQKARRHPTGTVSNE